MATQTSNYGTGLGLDTKGPDDPSTGYVSNPTTYQSRGTTWAAPGESTVGLYVRRKIVRNEDCTERHVSAKNVILEKVLVAKIGTTEKWKYEFAGWTQTGHLFDDGNCATEDVECKLTAFDDLQVKHGLVLESGEESKIFAWAEKGTSTCTNTYTYGVANTLKECEDGAAALGLAVTTASSVTNPSFPSGCFKCEMPACSSVGLYFNAWENSAHTGNEGWTSLCVQTSGSFSVHVHNPLRDPTKTLREIFAEVEDQTAVAFGTVRVDDWPEFGVVGEKTQSDITIGTFTIKAMMMSASSSDEYALLGGAQARLPGGSQVQSSCAGMSSMDADAYQDVCMAWSSHFFYGKGFGADDCIGDVRLGRWGTGSNGHSRTWMANYCTGLGCRTKGPDDPSTTGYVSSATTYKEQGSTWVALGKLTTSVYVLREVAAGTVKKATEASCGATTCVTDGTVLNAAGNPTCTVEDGACYCKPGFTLPTCTAKTCNAAGSVANSDKTGTTSITGTTGQAVTITCDVGYRQNGATLTATCGTNGEFTSPGVCGAQACCQFGLVCDRGIPHSDKSNTNDVAGYVGVTGIQHSFETKFELVVTCDAGYLYRGDVQTVVYCDAATLEFTYVACTK